MKKLIAGFMTALIAMIPLVSEADNVFGKRVTMWLIHNYYEEECYQYRYITWNTTEFDFCDSDFRYAMYCGDDNLHCNCPEPVYHNVTHYNKTDDCVKYHLVRRSGRT